MVRCVQLPAGLMIHHVLQLTCEKELGTGRYHDKGSSMPPAGSCLTVLTLQTLHLWVVQSPAYHACGM